MNFDLITLPPPPEGNPMKHRLILSLFFPTLVVYERNGASLGKLPKAQSAEILWRQLK